eukprot:m51a1_g4719 hypothetical protein (283) ;mRNA; f:319379-320351
MEIQSRPEAAEAPASFARRRTVLEREHGRVRLREFDAAAACDGAPAVAGFAGASLAPVLTAGYLADKLALPLVAAITCPAFSSRCIIEGGAPVPSARVYGDARAVVVACDVRVEGAPDIAASLADAVLDFATRHRCPLLVVVEGDPSATSPPPAGADSAEPRQLAYLTSSAAFASLMASLGHRALRRGVVSGQAAAVLAEAALRCDGPDVACVLAPTTPGVPEAGSAVAAVRAVGEYLRATTGAAVDTAELERKARMIRDSVAGIISESESSARQNHAMMFA